MLYIIGLGLGDERDITLRGLEAVKRCNKVYMEAYTSLLSFGFSSDSLSTLETLLGKVITIVDTETLEERADELLLEARVSDVAFLVVGDPFGEEIGVFVKVVHNASVMTAVGDCGLQLYRYGETVSIPFFTETWRPDSFYEKIQRNRMLGLHTPCLLASLDFTAQTGNASSEDWQEEVYQKIKTMKDEYLPELNEMYQKIVGKLQQHDSLPQQPKNENLEKLKIFRTMLERMIAFLQVSKSNILPVFKDKLGSYEKQIINFINSNRPRKLPGRLPLAHMPSMQQSQWSQSQITQVQPPENQMNRQLQSMNLQGSVSTMQQNNVTNLQHNSLSSLSGVLNVSQSMINTLQPSSNIDSGQGNALSTLQQVAVGPLQQIPVNTSQQVNMNSLSSQSGMNALQANLTPLESNSNMLQHQHLKQQEQLMLQTQQMKQLYQQPRQMQQQLIHIEQMMQQQQQQRQQMPQLRQMNDVNELKMRVGVKAEGCQKLFSNITLGQRLAYHHQQLKSGPSYPISSPQFLQAAAPQMPQHPSPQFGQQNLLTSLTKTGTPLLFANSPFIVPSPSTPLAPSPIPGEFKKVNSGVSALSNTGNIGRQQTTGVVTPAQSLAIDIHVKEPSLESLGRGRKQYEPPRCMTIKTAIEQLLEVKQKHTQPAYNEDTTCVGFARLGSEDQMVVAGSMKQLLTVDFGAPLHCLVIVGETHPVEEEMLGFYTLGKIREETLFGLLVES
ncbi:unnamed protein product [Camellia sinensis]